MISRHRLRFLYNFQSGWVRFCFCFVFYFLVLVLRSRLHFERAEPVQHHGLMCTNCKISIVLTATVDCTGPCFHHIKCRIKQEAGFRLSFRLSFLPRVLFSPSSILQSMRRSTPLFRPVCRPSTCILKEGGTRGPLNNSEAANVFIYLITSISHRVLT